MNTQHAEDVRAGQRFAFGENWSRFLTVLNDERVRQAEQSLCGMLQVEDLKGKTFLDIGSGSGLFSLAARRLGATVHSFDYDPQSVSCTGELKRRYFPDDPQWVVEQGSVLDEGYISSLGLFDIVYSWGVLHHTGQMYASFSLVAPAVGPKGKLFLAIYNDQRIISKYWMFVKKYYNRSAILAILFLVIHTPYLIGGRWIARAFTDRLSLQRGMSLWHDMLDWLGGFPFEVAKPEEVFRFFRDRGFALQDLKTCGGRMGCNEFVFYLRE
ncbi:class I SAM-dependent methyltransferase [Inquilinus sp. CAU 1745]|uniref:class I SAM-dependent methyltransferase n=1 Tax=Inquilinus sp. CAU 1745 TaxID=3140369 RepID=UPI00325B671D